MDKERLIVNENELSYEEILKIKEHAKKYDEASDKKEFLKSAGAYEQKIILLESKNPYEVLNYLSELELETSKLILSSLKFEEVKQILELFSLEDKNNFYRNFSDLELVNQFITIDENSKEHIKNLTFDRKVELIDSSNSNTIEASEILYESMPYTEREIASNLVTNANAVSSLSQVDTYNDDARISEIAQNNNINMETIKLENPDKIEQKIEKEIEKQQEEQKDKMAEQINIQKAEFLKNTLQHYLKTNPEFASLMRDQKITYELLPDSLKFIVDRDFELSKEKEKNELEQPKKLEEEKQLGETQKTEQVNEIKLEENNQTLLEEFQTVKLECEQQEIEKIKNTLEPHQHKNETQKTL